MRGFNFKTSSIISIKGGYNTPLHLVTTPKKEKIVIKQYGYETNECLSKLPNKKGLRIIKDTLELRKKYLKANLNIPKLFLIKMISDKHSYLETIKNYNKLNNLSITGRIILIEEYTGISAKDLIKRNKMTLSIFEEIKNYIFNLPNNIIMDAKPSNFTILNNKIFYVDFIPPKISEYQNDDEILNLFPYLKLRTKDREERRLWRYKTKEGRLKRYIYYFKKENL